MQKLKLSRRSVVRGLGGVSLSLPFLELMAPRTAQAAAPRRFVVCWAGCSLGTSTDQFTPDTVGASYDLKRALLPLEPVKADVSVVTGLKIPWATNGVVPSAGRTVKFHVSSLSPMLSGVRTSTEEMKAFGPTCDQLVAAAIAGDTRFKSLEYRVQAAPYRGGTINGIMSYRKGADGKITPNAPTSSPRLAFDSLFTGLAVPSGGTLGGTGGTPAPGGGADTLAFDQDRSVLDLVRGNAERLMARLGRADRQRLQRHFDEIRDVEKRLLAAAPGPMAPGGPPAPTMPTGACVKPAAPGNDPPIASGADATSALPIGYANEELRARVMTDLIHLALACDQSRVVSLMYTFGQCFMNAEPLFGVKTDVHQISHMWNMLDKMSDAVAWQVGHFARLVQKLRDTPEAGGTMLDNTTLVMVFEGGHGFDPEGNKPNEPHSTENMGVLVAGRAGGLRPGRHIPGNGAHPGSVVLSAMKSVGGPAQLGEISNDFPALFG